MSTSKGPLKHSKTGKLAVEAGLDDAEIAGISGGVTHHHTPAHKMVAASHASEALHQAATDAAMQQHDAAQTTAHVDAMTPAAQGAIGVAVLHQDAAQTVGHAEVMTPVVGAIGAALQQQDAAKATPHVDAVTPAAQGAIGVAMQHQDAAQTVSHAEVMTPVLGAIGAALQQQDAAKATPQVDAVTPAAQGAIGVAMQHQDTAQTVSHAEVMTPVLGAIGAALQQQDAAKATPQVDAMTPATQGAIGVAMQHQDAAQTVSNAEVMTPAAKGAIAAALQQHDAAQAAPQIHEMTPAAQGAIAAAIKLNDAGHAGATFASALDPLVEASPQKGVLVSSLKDLHGTEVSGDAGKSASNFLGGAALDGALLQSYYKAPTDSAGAHTEKDATHVLATAGAGVTNTVDLGHGVNLVSQANASATTEAHVGPLGVGANVVLNAKVSETLNLTEHADISVVAKATGDVHAKASVITGVGATADGGVNAEASINQHEKGSLGGGVDGMQQTTLAAGLDAHAIGGANVGLNGVSGGFGAFAGAYAKVGETAGIEGGGVKASGSVEVYSPGVVGVNQSGTFDVHDGKLNIAFSIGGAFGIGGLSIGGNVSINTAPLVDAGKAVGDFFGGIFGGGSVVHTEPTPQQNKLAAEYREAYQHIQQYTDQIMHGYEHHGKHSHPPTHAELQQMHNQALAAAEKNLHFDAITAKFAKEYNAAGTMGVTNGADQAGAIRMFADMNLAKLTGHETVTVDPNAGFKRVSNDSVWAGPSR